MDQDIFPSCTSEKAARQIFFSFQELENFEPKFSWYQINNRDFRYGRIIHNVMFSIRFLKPN